MKEKLPLSVYITYIVSGYVWLGTVLLSINLIRRIGFVEANLVNLFFSLLLAFTLGVAFKPFADGLNRRLGRILLGSEEDIHVDNELRWRITEKASRYSSHRVYYDMLEYQLDDLMSVNGVRNSWSKYYYLSDFMKQVYLSGVCFSILLMINVMVTGNVLLFTVLMLTSIFFLFACRLSYTANMKAYINEVQMSFLFYHSSCNNDLINLDEKREVDGNSQNGTA